MMYNKERVLGLDDEGLPAKESKNIYLQFHPWTNALVRNAYRIGNVYNVKDQIKQNVISPIRIPVEADIVWPGMNDFYEEHEIGKHYACEGQRA